MPNQINEADFIQTQTLIGQTYSLQRVPEVGAAWGRERHLLASSQSMYSVSESTLSIFNFFKHIWATTNFTFSLTWEKLECKCKKAKKKHWKIWEIRRKEYEKEWCEIGRWRSLVRCSTLKEAELIPDSAVPYTLPESRWNSSNRQNVKTSNEGEGEELTQLTTCVRKRSTQDGGTEVAVLERPNRSLLVRGESGQPKYVRVCVFVCAFECVSGQCCCLRLQVEEGKREGRASGCEECSQQFGCSTVTEQSHRTAASVMAHSFRCGMPLENSPMHAFHARVYVWVWVNLRKHFDLFIPSFSLNSLERCDS